LFLEPFVAALSESDATRTATTGSAEISIELDDSISRQAAVSAALVSVFRGNFCDLILPNRVPTTFKKSEVIYNVGDERRTFFFLTGGFVKVGTITANGREVIYDIRRGGDVVGELCVSEPARPDRAVALEQTDAIAVPLEDVLDVLQRKPDMIAVVMNVFCRHASEYSGGGRHHSSAGQNLDRLGGKAGSALRLTCRDSDISYTRRNCTDGGGATGKNFDGVEFPAPPGNGALLGTRTLGVECERP
jgi:hypothetical protein